MASFLPHVLFLFSLFSSLFLSINGILPEDSYFISEAKPIKRTEKMSHLHFYFHDIPSGKSPSAVKIISSPPKANSASGLFGETLTIDDALTIGQENTSKIVGRAEGFYSMASQGDVALLMATNFVFTEGKYNGSTVSILGRNPVLNDVREMPIIAGSGLFRFARGYSLAHTIWFESKTGDAVVEYNVFVLHY